WDVLDDRVLDAVASVRREEFVPTPYRAVAFADLAIPLSEGEEMLPPKIEGRLLQTLQLESSDKVLEIGTGSGYMTACLARLTRRVVSIDIRPEFIANASRQLADLNIANAELIVRDLFRPWDPEAFDAIAVTGSMPSLDERLRQWLKPGGRLFVVVGEAPVMEARRITRVDDQNFITESLFETVLSPLRNAPRPSPFQF